MRCNDGYRWPTYYEVHGLIPWSKELYPLPIRCGLITPSADEEPAAQHAIAIGINDEVPLVITPESAARLREILSDIAREYAGIMRQNEARQSDAAQQLLGDAGVVISSERWQAVLAAMSSDDPTKREQLLAELKDEGPPQ